MSDDARSTDEMASRDGLLQLRQLLGGYTAFWTVHAAVRLNLPEALADGAVVVEELADRCGAEPQPLRRLLRVLALLGIVEAQGPDHFGPTERSHWLRRDTADSQRSAVLLAADPAVLKAWASCAGAIQGGETAFDLANGQPFFDHLDDQPDLLRAFHDASGAPAELDEALADSWDFSACRRVVDVGGGDGAFAARLSGRHPGLQATVLERPAVVAAHSRGPAAAVTFQDGDFLKEVPDGADVYLLRLVLHDWDDDVAVVILTNCRQALADDGRVLIIEYLVDSAPPAVTELLDLNMLVLTGGRERSRAEYDELIQRAGLRIVDVHPTPVGFSIIEAAKSEPRD